MNIFLKKIQANQRNLHHLFNEKIYNFALIDYNNKTIIFQYEIFEYLQISENYFEINWKKIFERIQLYIQDIFDKSYDDIFSSSKYLSL